MHSQLHRRAGAVLALALAASTPIAAARDDGPPAPQKAAGPLTPVFTNVPGAPSAAVPGLPGISFRPGNQSTIFGRPFHSPSGHWILTARTDDPLVDQIVLVDGSFALGSGLPVPGQPGKTLTTFAERLGINDSGQWAFSMSLSGGGPKVFIGLVEDGLVSFAAFEDDPIPALPGAIYDAVLTGVSLQEDGTAAFEADLVDGAPVTTSTDELLLRSDGGTIVAREGVTVPSQQAGGGTQTVENFDFENYYVSPDGAHALWKGDLNGFTNDDVVVFDGQVVLQEGVVLPGSGLPHPIEGGGAKAICLDHAGNWFARGDIDVTNDDFVVRNGQVIELIGDPVVPGATELWSDSTNKDGFFANVGNANGEFLVGGYTDHPNTDQDSILVLNNRDIVVREGEAFDLDGNGLLDDGVHLGAFIEDKVILTHDCRVHFAARIVDANGTQLGSGVFRVDLELCACGPITKYGQGCDGSGGVVPVLGAEGCVFGGSNFTIELEKGLGGSSALLFLGLAEASLPVAGSCSLLVNILPIFPTLPLGGSGAGNGSIAIPATLPATLGGLSLHLQAFVTDPGVPRGFSATNGLKIGLP